MTHSPFDPQSAPGAPGAAPQGSARAPGPAPGTDLGADLGAGLRFAGTGLLRGAAALLGVGALYAVAMLVVVGVGFALTLFLSIAMVETSSSAGGDPSFGQMIVIFALCFVLVLVAGVVGALWQAGAAQAGGILAGGERPSFRQGLIGSGRVVTTAVLVLVIVMIGSVLLYLPGIIAAVLLFYAIPAALRGASPGQALRESVATATSNLGVTIVGFLITMVASSIGGTLVVGFIAVIPFTVLLQIGLYERVNGRTPSLPA
ncbi:MULTISPECIES: hypothetical protein [Brachybacterium]|uniref:hypothetical protein n=1 Tax=Brachybacterium TaxID=43668 RepID=UPI0006B5FC0D|nr:MULTISPECIES: hypothetical protein [Brachybacterium]MCZ4326800.1 hypothetical protein [Brachybacterium paraconglomeratum]GAP80527.1 hypothetical protein Y09_3389 [Brachybacterium sp. SW0106-09]